MARIDLLDVVKVYWRFVIIFCTPIILSPIAISNPTHASKCGFVLCWMGVYWMTEVIPLSVTALLPTFLFPFLGILDGLSTCQNYFKDSNFLFFGGLVVALGIEECNLHRRIALAVLLKMGSQPRWLMLGFMIVTCFLSMWMSNTATTAMMVPIALAVLQELMRYQISVEPTSVTSGRSIAPDEFELSNLDHFHTLSKHQKRMCKGVLLSICYAGNIGGTGSLTGTVANVVVLNSIQNNYKNETGLTYASWLAFGVPEMILLLFISWFWLQIIFLGLKSTLLCVVGIFRKRKSVESDVDRILRAKYMELGSLKPIEMIVIVLFITLVFLWIFRSPRFIDGWGVYFKEGYVKDSAVSMMIACSLFLIPKNIGDILHFRKDETGIRIRPQMLLNWSIMQHRFPWGIIILLGGGFALADGVDKSGLSDAIGIFLKNQLGNVSPVTVVSIAVIVVTFLTEFVSNTATAIIFVPILLDLADNMQVHPFYFALPVGIATSFAFCMPVATPPNAIVFGTGLLHIIDMMLAGLGMNLIGIGICLFWANTWTTMLFNLNQIPSWAKSSISNIEINSTTVL